MQSEPNKQKRPPIGRSSKGTDRLSYNEWAGGIATLLEEARRQSARSVNAILTATYWEIGRRIVEFCRQAKRGRNMGMKFWTGLQMI